MPIEIQVAKVNPNTPKTFTFANVIQQQVVGLTGFSLSYGNTDHHVGTMEISLKVSQSQNNLTVAPIVALYDKTGHTLDNNASSITIAAIAWVGVNNSNLTLANAAGIPNDRSSAQISISGTNPNILQAFLSGFYLSYGDTDHHLETAGAEVGANLVGQSAEAQINGWVYMHDQSGNNAAAATVDGGLFSSTDHSLGVQLASTGNLQFRPQTIEFDKQVANACALLTGYKVQFQNSDDHHVKTIACDLTSRIISSSNAVTVSGSATLIDKTGHVQDDQISYVSGVVIAY